MESLLELLSSSVATLAETAAVVIIGLGATDAFLRVLVTAVRPRATHLDWKAAWRRFGVWLLLGLEFELAADVVKSVISRSWQNIASLAAIAVIRTFLNYFLEKDLEDAAQASGPGG